jgi:hypothetical protein
MKIPHPSYILNPYWWYKLFLSINVDALDGHNIYYVGPHSLANHKKINKINSKYKSCGIKLFSKNKLKLKKLKLLAKMKSISKKKVSKYMFIPWLAFV